MRYSRLATGLVLAAILPNPTAASAKPFECKENALTCHPEKRHYCCRGWSIDVKSGGGTNGLLWEPSYEALMKAFKRRQWEDNALCRFFGPKDSSCGTTYGAPKCADTVGAFGNLFDSPEVKAVMSGGGSSLLPYVQEWAQGKAQAHIEDQAKLNDLKELAIGWVTAGMGQPNVISNLLEPTLQLAQETQDQVSSAKNVQRCIERGLSKPLGEITDGFREATRFPSDSALQPWTVGGAFGGQKEAIAAVAPAILARRRPQPPSLLKRLTLGSLDNPQGTRSKVVRTDTAGGGVLIFGRHGRLRRGGEVPSGRTPILFACRSGRHTYLGTVDVTERSRSGSREIVVRGSGPNCKAEVVIRLEGDRDGDGIADHRDRCPEEKGPERTRGCPDRDNDGIADKDDRCPDDPSTTGRKGCPKDREQSARGSSRYPECEEMLSRMRGAWSCPPTLRSPAGTFRTPVIRPLPCLRDKYAAKAVLFCWTAVCYGRLGAKTQAEASWENAKRAIKHTLSMCHGRTVVEAESCTTLGVLPCSQRGQSEYDTSPRTRRGRPRPLGPCPPVLARYLEPRYWLPYHCKSWKKCAAGDAKECGNLGSNLYADYYKRRDAEFFRVILKLYDRACRLGFRFGCTLPMSGLERQCRFMPNFPNCSELSWMKGIARELGLVDTGEAWRRSGSSSPAPPRSRGDDTTRSRRSPDPVPPRRHRTGVGRY